MTRARARHPSVAHDGADACPRAALDAQLLRQARQAREVDAGGGGLDLAARPPSASCPSQ